MKAILIMHNAAIDVDVNEALEAVDVKCYSKFPNMLGRGQISEPHLSTDIWPQVNHGTFIVTGEVKAKEIMNVVRRMREKLGTEGIKAFMWEIEDVT